MPRRTFWRNEPNAFQRRDVISLTPRAPPPLPGSAPPILAVENVQKGCHAGTPEWPPPGAPNPCQKGQTCRTGQIVRYLNRTSRVLATAILAAPCGNRFAKLMGCCWTLWPRGCRPLHDVEATRPMRAIRVYFSGRSASALVESADRTGQPRAKEKAITCPLTAPICGPRLAHDRQKIVNITSER